MNFKEIMEFNAPYNQRNITKLIEKIKSNCIVPYVGAGMSILFENVYPSWNGFLHNTFEEFVSETERTKFDSLNNEEKADFLNEEMGNRTFADHLKSTFGQKHLERESKEFVGKSVYLLPIIFEKGLLITTNYDRVIEKMYGLYEKVLPVAHPGHFEALNGALRDGDLLLYKIHGDIGEPISSIILTKEQYELAYRNPDLKQALKQVYTTKEILFLGCSIAKDRPIELLCEVSRAGMNNYAIIACEGDDAKKKRLQLENEYYTQSIIYPEGRHECVNILLDYIAKTINPQIYQIAIGKYNDKNTLKDMSLELSEEWFVNQNRIQIKNLGNRYLPDLNVELSIKNVFDALGRNECFYKYFIEKTDKVLIAVRDTKLVCLKENTQKIYDIVKNFEINSIVNLNIEDIINEADIILQLIDAEISVNYEKLHDKSCKNRNAIQNNIFNFNNAHNLIYDYITYINSSEVGTVNNPYILLYGEGGIGKSHIIADTIMKRNADGKKSLLFLGQHFKENNNPIVDMLKMLELDCYSEQLLEKLNQIAEENKSRIIIFIDALNEGNGKKIWKDYLAGMVEKFKLFPWIGLVVSIRTEYVESLFADNHKLESELIKVNHQGFSTLEYSAIKKYFKFYNIQYTDIPFAEQEFRNPLFLRLLCDGFKNKSIDLSKITFTDVYKNYLLAINLRISEICEYSRHINIVEKVINEMVLYKHNVGVGNNLIPLSCAIEIIMEIERRNNIKNSLLDELLSNGVITQNVNYNNEECVYVTYEKLDDYLYAKLLISELENIGVDQFRIKYKKLLRYGDILEALAIALSENAKYELFELFEKEKSNLNIISSFCNSMKWRKSDTITSNVVEYINDVVLKSKSGFKRLFDALVLISTKMGHSFNAERTVEYILNYPMPDRDAAFIPLFDEFYYEEGSSINRLLDWCLSKKVSENTLEETIRLTAFMLATFLISSNNSLRDKTTKALVNLLNGRIDILISLLDKYKNVDDPYIIERLYAVAFGCIVSEQRNEKIESLALYVYNSIFKMKYIYPNMILRDYAKSIIEYAKYKVASGKLLSLNVLPPYKSDFPEVPTDEEILKYEYDYKAPNFKEYFWGQNSILSSMKVEYNRNGAPGGYGDFGRYTFQSYFSNWDGLNYNDLENIAIKKIFDLGYDVEKHGRYDRIIESGRHRDGSRERIGKKYQWIALYELAAQVADNYKMQIHTGCYGDKEAIYCKGSFEPNLRNIDPTALIVPVNNGNKKNMHHQLFEFSSGTNNEWLSRFSDFPTFDNLVKLAYQNQNYIMLNGCYVWTEEKDLGEKQYQNHQKDMWIQINSYIVKEESYEETIMWLRDKDFMGRGLSEPSENYYLFNKEYYWSDAYHFYKDPYYCGDDWTGIDKYGNGDEKYIPVLIPTSKYITERKGDTVGEGNSNTWYKPCMDLFESLDMKYGKDNSTLYNFEGDIICFDSSELLNEDIGFFINQESFCKYLEDHNYKVFWTILEEKRIITGEYNSKEKYRQPRISGIFTIDENGDFIGETNEFED
ncbi:SIR2 family NAD-dependent protein deacylase [Clostridium estertheticum]|uniref:SIR2 family NAD-dependent protein deacylase n=1 Tax=Clostridium estertheticum TaxID=238834 RepID=UPI001C0B58D4|nr:SIR2 family protein [Clostridium estertheticum]MBU3183253.1 SIR2 family protein [Clostridium estertheticum]